MLFKRGRIFAKPQSVILFRMSLRVLGRADPFTMSQIWREIASPSSAFVKSTVSRLSVRRPSSIFSYFSGILIDLIFFLRVYRAMTGSFFSSLPFSSFKDSFVVNIVFLRVMILVLGGLLLVALIIREGVSFSWPCLIRLSSRILERTTELPCSNSSRTQSRLSSSSSAQVLTRFLMSSQNSQFAKSLVFSFQLNALLIFLSQSFSFSQSYTMLGMELRHGPSLKKTPISSIYFWASMLDFSSCYLSCSMMSLPLSMRFLPLRQNSSSPSCVPDSQELKRFSAVKAQDSQMLTVFSSMTRSFFIFLSMDSSNSSSLWKTAFSALLISSWIRLNLSEISFLRECDFRVRDSSRASFRFLLVILSSTPAFSSKISSRVSQIFLFPCSTWSRLTNQWPLCWPKRAHLEQRRWESTKQMSSTCLLWRRQSSLSPSEGLVAMEGARIHSPLLLLLSSWWLECSFPLMAVMSASASSSSWQERLILGTLKDSSLKEIMERVLMLFFLASRKLTRALLMGSMATRSSTTSKPSSGQTMSSLPDSCSWASELRHFSQKVCPQMVKSLGKLPSLYSFMH